MSRIALFIDQTENRRLLAEWLAAQHEVITPASPADIDEEFDLGIVDAPSLERHGDWFDALRASAYPLFLPFLLVAPRHAHAATTIANVWERVDELLVTPVEKVELRARVQTLLRARSLSLANAALARRLEAEIARAREVQAGLLPRDTPALSGYELAARCIPARDIGGDFFDWETVDGAAVVSVGDVMGKGIPAALLAATVRAVLRALARQNPPGSTLDLLGRALAGDLERTSSFVTLFHARVAPGEVRYVDAGHGHALVRRAAGALERLDRGGRPVGFPAAAPYHEAGLCLARGDCLVVFSDGLIEETGRRPEELVERLDPEAPASALVDELVAQAPKADSADDVTVLVLKCVA